MTDATTKPTNVTDKASPSKEPEHTSWASSFASSVWGAAKVTGDWAAGAAKEVMEHPLKTAAEVGAGIATTAVAAELGVGVAAGAAIGGVALAGYGVYRGAQIAATEGVGAIPEHMRQSYNDTKNNLSGLIDAASTVYHGEGGQKERDAAERLESAGRASVPFAAAIVGGTGGEIGQAAIRGGANAINDILPSLSFQPELAYAGAGRIAGNAMSAIQSATISGEHVAVAGAAGATVSKMTGGNEPTYNSQHEFVHGKRVSAVRPPDDGIATKISNELPSVDKIIKEGGEKGGLKFVDEGKGMISIEVTDGPQAGLTGLYDKNEGKLLLEGKESRSYVYQLPKR